MLRRKKIFAKWYLTNPNIFLFKNLLKFTLLWMYKGFELIYHDPGNIFHFSFFLMQFFPPCQKITIPRYNIFSFALTEKQNFFAATIKKWFQYIYGMFHLNSFVAASCTINHSYLKSYKSGKSCSSLIYMQWYTN